METQTTVKMSLITRNRTKSPRKMEMAAISMEFTSPHELLPAF
jgi:hypothetical protein